jgi:predicted TIM-barrel fold metal-dependent hydrolase
MLKAYDLTRNAVRSFEEADAWHGRAEPETPLDPERPIVDPHHHLGRNAHGLYTPADYLADAEGHRIVATVFIECNTMYRTHGPEALRCVGETEFVVNAVASSDAAARRHLCDGIVAKVDLRLGERARPVLEAQIEAGQGRVRGIRHQLRWDANGIAHYGRPSPSQLAFDPSFRTGFAHLAPLGLSFDAWVFHSQLSEIVDLAQAFPDTAIIVNHVGGPLGVGEYANRRDEVFAQWRVDIAALARCPNVQMKLGGLGMLCYGFGFYQRDTPPGSAELARAWKPYVDECIDRFGVDRCMFESNFPVDKQTCSARVLWNAFKRMTSDLSEPEKTALFSGTGARTYRLAVPPRTEGVHSLSKG